MEDQELKSLFEAKRTVEANRRRQADLEAMIAAEAATSRRRPWLWLGSAAAAIALLLLSLPLLFRSSAPVAESPIRIAQQSHPTPSHTEPTAAPAPTPSPTPVSTPMATPRPLDHTAPIAQAEAPSPAPDSLEAPHPSSPTLEEALEEALEPQPSVLRRQSTLIACTEDCEAPSYITPTQPHIAFIGSNPQLADTRGIALKHSK